MRKLILFMTLITQVIYVQGQDFVWAKQMSGTNNETGISIAVDAGGNVYTTGRFEGTVDFDPGAAVFNLTSAGSGDIFISKLDAFGNFIWARQIGGSGNDVPRYIAIDNSGNVYTTGAYAGIVDFDPSPGISTLSGGGGFISKLNTSGDFDWAVRLDVLISYALTLDGGNVYVTGQSSGTAGSITDIFVAKFGTDGAFLWEKKFGGNSSRGNGESIAVDGSGNVYTTGNFQSTVDFNPDPVIVNNLVSGGSFDIFVSKLDGFGNFVWAKSIGSTNIDQGVSIAVEASGNVYTTGSFEGTVDFDPGPGVLTFSAVSSFDIFVFKLDETGDLIWAKQMGGSGDENGLGLAVNSSGNVLTTGYFTNSVDFDPGPGTFNLTPDPPGTGMFLSNLDAFGNFVSAKSFGSYSIGRGIVIDPGIIAGGLYITGDFDNTVDFNPGSGTFNMTSGGGFADIFILKLTNGTDADGDGYSIAQGDCDDNNPAIHPNATEVCNDIDDDCDGQIDEAVKTTFYRDADGDGYGNSSQTTQACTTASGYTAASGDCNDNNPAVNPGTAEVCSNGLDDDCDGQTDETGCIPCQNATGLTTTDITATNAKLNWNATANPLQWQLRYKRISPGSQWTTMSLTGNLRSVNISSLVPNSMYNWQIRAKCGNAWTQYTAVASFTSSASIAGRAAHFQLENKNISEAKATAEFKLYPNPSGGEFNLIIDLQEQTSEAITIHVIDIQGKIILSKHITVENGYLYKQLSMPSHSPAGIYIVKIITGQKVFVSKLVIAKQ